MLTYGGGRAEVVLLPGVSRPATLNRRLAQRPGRPASEQPQRRQLTSSGSALRAVTGKPLRTMRTMAPMRASQMTTMMTL